MLPVVALVGRPNVGKSTLFNRLTRSRDALVGDMPGLTRDRQYGIAEYDSDRFVVIDTGGLTESVSGVEALMDRQVQIAVDEADVLVFLVDVRDGLNAADQQIAAQLRRADTPVVVAVNKAEGREDAAALADFYELGFDSMTAVSATHGSGLGELLEKLHEFLPPPLEVPESREADDSAVIAVVGRPNVGKSTLINRLIGEERLVAFDQPGTTRDSVRVPFSYDGEEFSLIDTAGVRRRARVQEAIEKFSVVKTLQAIDAAHVVILLLDAREGIAEQDASLLGHVIGQGRALVIGINKWDRLEPDQRDTVRRELDLKLGFCDFAERHFISALHGTGIHKLLRAALRARDSAFLRVPTPRLTEILEQAVQGHSPPLVRGRAPKLRYAHQGGVNPVRIIVHGSRTDALPKSYQRYIANTFRKRLRVRGAPVRVEFRSGKNPYAGKTAKKSPKRRSRKKGKRK